ncbi:unnamed protein product [Pseudo-nitzschia multistriata]|uniref:SUI1 domain-containing protein n=1 Tax=Pseudo-nitzschia multistriata TaxID=183589 RepID=A0A448YYJ6_9STRA|nr:unnamed protein product [Pseudo-nitzschia multistriata]
MDRNRTKPKKRPDQGPPRGFHRIPGGGSSAVLGLLAAVVACGNRNHHGPLFGGVAEAFSAPPPAPVPPPGQRFRALFLASGSGDDPSHGDRPAPKKKTKKKSRRLVLNPNLDRDLFAKGGVATITPDGVVVAAEEAGRPRSSKLGVPTKPRKPKKGSGSGKSLSAKARRLRNQRTAGGTIDSSASEGRKGLSSIARKEDEPVRIATARRGSKTVTMVQGMGASTPPEERKALLKKLKARVGGGGTLVDGVLEVQGSHAETVLGVLRSAGYAKASIVGGGGSGQRKKTKTKTK